MAKFICAIGEQSQLRTSSRDTDKYWLDARMCVMRHSAARPNRLPPVSIKRARRWPFSTDWNIESITDVDAQGRDVTDAWTPAAVANDNEGLRRKAVADFCKVFSV